MKIAVYAIAKNEATFVERFCASAKDADMILMADTGSTDATVEIAKRCGAIVHDICISPWRFDLARNAALALVPRDIDVCISLDLDEVLEPGWREEIELAWTSDTTRMRYFFDWGRGIRFFAEKIHSRNGYLWHHPVHEALRPDARLNEIWAQTYKLVIRHLPDDSKPRSQYLELLELSVKEDPMCQRNAFYLAREYTYRARWTDATVALKSYLSMSGAAWDYERSYAHRLLGRCAEEMGNTLEAEAQYHRACAEVPLSREPWCALSFLMYKQHKWLECYSMAMRALSITDRQMVYTADPDAWSWQPHDLASISAWHLGMKDVAAEQARLAVEKAPDDLRLQNNHRIVTEKMEAA